ncbi:MAG: hypothetical protein EOO67_16265 [Microbacterium sp.]|nr:MAG: hypothetical protein EOO67_16265 [Microbacterium sp.]
MSEWEFVDVWVFAAIGGYGRPCTLVEMISSADMINHAILLEDELTSALGKLAGAGLLRVFEDWTFELTDDGTTVWTSEVRDLTAHLKTVQARFDDFEPGTTVVKLPRGLMAAAVEEYRSR